VRSRACGAIDILPGIDDDCSVRNLAELAAREASRFDPIDALRYE